MLSAPDVLIAKHLDQRAALFNAQGKYSQAELLYKRSLSIYKKALFSGKQLNTGPEPILQALGLAAQDYACLLTLTNRSSKAKQFLDELISVLQEYGYSDLGTRLARHGRQLGI